ncbi:hypothetical protein LAZ67_1001957 [Cordylochernes scorpioides]|uniref:Retrotransposon gag domain-containing protein n=1 Tax=Cordylochernes scorpioides TaxID=51811 RepID=A0ABY6JWK8_9ARAC|nr:hypothetical protein LAZ67_1001957 [Cordylochernes scorpioides]
MSLYFMLGVVAHGVCSSCQVRPFLFFFPISTQSYQGIKLVKLTTIMTGSNRFVGVPTGLIQWYANGEFDKIKLIKQDLQEEETDLADSTMESSRSTMESILRTMANQQRLMTDFLLTNKSEIRVGRPVKMDVATFDGRNVDPKIWIKVYENICGNNGWVGDEARINGMRSYLTGSALLWFDNKYQDEEEYCWKDWKQEFIGSFNEKIPL